MYTGLETILISLLTAVVACIALLATISRSFMTCKSCNLRHDGLERDCDLRHKQIADDEEKNQIEFKKQMNLLIKKHDIQFRMLREIIVHLDLPPDRKAQILNMTNGD